MKDPIAHPFIEAQDRDLEEIAEPGLQATASEGGDDYRMQHRPPGRDGTPIHDMTHNFPADIYTHPHYYSDMSDPTSAKAHNVINRVRDKPEANVHVYRALPAEHAHQGFRPGDWVSTSKDYARQHGRHATDPKHDWPVIHTIVKAKDLHTDGDDFREYGYNGTEAKPGDVALGYKGGHHQEVSDRAEGGVRPVQRRANPTKGYSFTHEPQSWDGSAGRVNAWDHNEDYAGHALYWHGKPDSTHIEPEHAHMADELTAKMHKMIPPYTAHEGARTAVQAPPEGLSFTHDDIETGGSKHPIETHLRAVHPEHGQVGAAIYFPPKRRDGRVVIRNLHVENDQRRQGIGSALMDEIQRRHPDSSIDHGDRTADGENWWSGYTQGKPVRRGRTAAHDDGLGRDWQTGNAFAADPPQEDKWGPRVRDHVAPNGTTYRMVHQNPTYKGSMVTVHAPMKNGGYRGVGYLGYTSRPDKGDDVSEVYKTHVHPDHQRQGLASAMLGFARESRPGLQHSPALTDDGRAWSEKVGATVMVRPSEVWGHTRDLSLPHHQRKVNEIADSIAEHGYRPEQADRPIHVSFDPETAISDGHHRLKAMEQIGYDVPVPMHVNASAEGQLQLEPTGNAYNKHIDEFDVHNHGMDFGTNTKVRFERSSTPDLNHRIHVYREQPPILPPIKGLRNRGMVEDVGHMSYHPETGRVEAVLTHDNYARRGVATGMWNLAKQLHEQHGTVAPAHSETQTTDGAAWAEKTSRYTPTKRVFTHTDGLDHRLFDADGHLRPEVRAYVLKSIAAMWTPQYRDWATWAHIYFAGSEASEWTSETLEGNDDFDVLVGVDYVKCRDANPFLREMSNQEITDRMNQQFRAFNGPVTLEIDGSAYGPFDRTTYVNPDSYDIKRIKPYAAYDVGADAWVVKPPHLPHWSLDDLPKAVVKVLRAAESYAKSVLKLPEPERTQQGAALFEAWHTDRSRAFSDKGEGWWDIANLREKWADQSGWWRELVNCKHRADEGLDAAPADWSNTPPSYTASLEKDGVLTAARRDPHHGDGPWFHGTSADLAPGDELHPGDEGEKSHGKFSDGSKVWVSNDPVRAAAYGHRLYEVTPHSRPRSPYANHDEHHTTGATVVREVPYDEARTISQSRTAAYEHRPAGPPRPDDYYEGGQPAHDLNFNRSRDSYDPTPGVRFQSRTLDDKADSPTAHVLRQARGNPEHPVTMYRALPREHAEGGIKTGDWVSLSKGYAQSHARANGGWPVVKATVPAKHLWTDGDYNEWGYHGPDVKAQVHSRGRTAS